MQKIYLEHLEALAIGATILGSGGGGDPSYDLMIAKQQLAQTGPVTIVPVEAISDEALVVPLEFMGAPLVSMEMLSSGREFEIIFAAIENHYQRKIDYLLTIEIGGANAFTPLIAASKFGLPLIDGDTLGRAFPTLNISSCNLKGISASPAFLCDVNGRCLIVEADSAFEMEEKCRKITEEMGSSAAISFYIMNGKQAKEAVIRKSVSRAIEIGQAMQKENPIQNLIDATHGTWIGSGVICDIEQHIDNAFLKGFLKIEGEKGSFSIDYQNEYLLVSQNGKIVGKIPDIIVLLEEESGKPIPSEALLFGLRISIVSFPSPDIWKTPEGLALTAPKCFGYEVPL